MRRYATARAPSVPKMRTSKPPARPAAPKRGPTSDNLDAATKLMKVQLAEQVYSEGKTLLYRAPRRLTYYRIQNWVLAAAASGTIAWMIADRMFDAEMWKSRGIAYPQAIRVVYTIVGAFLAAIAGVCVYRPGGHVHTIGLVKQLDNVFLQVSVRTRLPFAKRRHVIQPYNLLLDPRLAAMKEIPDWMISQSPDESSPSAFTAGVLSNSLRAISRFFFSIFASARQFISLEGIISVDLLKEEAGTRQILRGFYLDADGQYLTYEKGEALLNIATFKDSRIPDID